MLTVSRKVFDGCNPAALPQLTWISQVARSSGDHRTGVTADGFRHQDVKPGMPEHDLRIVRRTAGVDRPPIQGTASRTDPSRRTPDLEIVGSRGRGLAEAGRELSHQARGPAAGDRSTRLAGGRRGQTRTTLDPGNRPQPGNLRPDLGRASSRGELKRSAARTAQIRIANRAQRPTHGASNPGIWTAARILAGNCECS